MGLPHFRRAKRTYRISNLREALAPLWVGKRPDWPVTCPSARPDVGLAASRIGAIDVEVPADRMTQAKTCAEV
ncbi:MAG: hypothetical protein ACOYEV_16235, partial [Candidatus Nanopelagicales bacterium]